MVTALHIPSIQWKEIADLRVLMLFTVPGIFFKALANFQWDRLLGTDIISKEYLEGCYQLGQVYPICARVFSWYVKKVRDERSFVVGLPDNL